MQTQSNHENSHIGSERDQISITTQVITLEIPKGDELSQAFKKIRNLPNFIKPIAMARLAKLLKISDKVTQKSYEAWMYEQVGQQLQNQNGEGR